MNVLALSYAKERGGEEAIFGNTQGHLCEGTGSNIFVVRDGEVITPPLASGCLAGVTRALVIELCAREEIPWRESLMPLAALNEMPEAFLTSTTRNVQPIHSVDGSPLPQVAGPLTDKLRLAFLALQETNPDP